jgi:hypothetical protein
MASKRKGTAPKADPIFAAVKAYKTTTDIFCRAALAEDRAHGIRKKRLAAIADDAERALARATRRLCNTPPRTLGGLLAIIKCLSPLYDQGPLGGFFDGRTANLFRSLIEGAKKIERRNVRAKRLQ